MKTFWEFIKEQTNEGILPLPDDLSQYTNLLMKKIQEACIPQYWQEGFAVLKENKVFGLQVRDTAVVIKPMSFEELVSQFRNSGNIAIAHYSTSPQPHMIIRIFYGYNPRMEIHTKVIPNAFDVQEIQSKIEHEFIHSIDPTSLMTFKKIAEDPSRQQKFAKRYQAAPYTTTGIGTGKIPIEFNTYMWEVIRASRNIPPEELRAFMKNPDENIPKALERHRSFIKSMLQNPSLRKMFLWKLSRAAA